MSSDATPVVLPSRRCSLELTADDLATALDASEAGDRSDVGRLASPLFPQEREVSANTFGASFSHSHSSIEKSRRDMNQRASIETSMTRKSSRDSGSVQGSQQERETILSEQRDLHNFLERKADQAFQGECAAQTKLSEAPSELDRREWKMQNVDSFS